MSVQNTLRNLWVLTALLVACAIFAPADAPAQSRSSLNRRLSNIEAKKAATQRRLRAATRAGVEPGLDEPVEDLRDIDPGQGGQEIKLHHRQGLEVDPRESLLQGTEETLVVIDLELRVKTADDVQLRHRFVDIVCRRLDGLVHSPGPSLVPLTPGHVKGTQLAGGRTDVGRVQMPVDVEEGVRSVQCFAPVVGEAPDTEEVVGGCNDDRVLAIETNSRRHLFGDRQEVRIDEPEGRRGVAHEGVR